MTPHCCPVCKGRGSVPAGFYTPWGHSTAEDTCRSCGGQGIVWSSGSPAQEVVNDPPATPKTRFFMGAVEVPVPEYEVVCDGQTCHCREKR